MPVDDKECLSFDNFFYNYGRFHNNPINKLIHVIFVPLIVLTLGVFSCELISPMEFNGKMMCPLPFILGSAMSIVYTIVDVPTGIVFGLFTVLGGTGVSEFYLAGGEYFGYSVLQFSLALNLTGWILQFVGHGVFEKRAPALITNLAYTLLAPFFVTFEIMNFFGYKSGDEMDKVMQKIEEDIHNFQQGKKTKSA